MLAINYREKILLVHAEGEGYRGVLAVAKVPARLSLENAAQHGTIGQTVGEIAEETGDIDWYQAIIEDETGVSEEDTRAKVIAKLRKRYPNKFDSDLAVNRDLGAERAAIEGASA